MGLAALLVRCGVALPCEGGEGAQVAPRCDFFAEVVTDISATADVQAGTSCVAHPHPHPHLHPHAHTHTLTHSHARVEMRTWQAQHVISAKKRKRCKG